MSARPSSAWVWLFGACVVAVGVGDAVVLGLAKAYFGSGYNGFALHGLGERAAFFAIGALLDGAAIAAVWCAALALARLARARPLRTIAAASLLSVALPLAFDLAMHRLHRVLGDVLDLGLLLELAAGSWSSALGEAAQDLPPLALLGFGGGLLAAVYYAAIARIERASPRLAGARLPRIRALAGACLVGSAIGASALAWSATRAPALEFGWGAKPAGRAIRATVGAITDVDRDGYGWLSQPNDPAPLDPRLHPYAVDVPQNGVDEDGVAGDLPASVEVPLPVAAPTPRPRVPAPGVVLIFLESFRADVVGLGENGHPVTPNLDRLAASGTLATAYAHVPSTWASRAALLQGRVVPTPGGSTLVDDLIERGYEVAWFSGQHDGVAEERARLGLERVAHFYDARTDVARRTSRSAQPISLQVSWKTVERRVAEYLEARDSDAPLFLYVNLVDTHFPYWHRELDDILGTGSLPRSAIRPENRAAVWRAYLNAAANVDRAIGEIVTRARAALGPDTLIVVTGDHGQSFYENGFLGHGQALDDAQTRVPLVVGGARARLPSPTALSDLRGLVGHWLDATPIPDAELAREEIFQHLGELARPAAVALRSRGRVIEVQPGSGSSLPSEPESLGVLRVWETLHYDAQKEKRRRL